MTALLPILWIVIGFLMGSVMFSRIIPKKLVHKDICEISDDHNPGVFNAFVHCGKKIGALCLLGDLMKGFLPVLCAGHFVDPQSAWFSPIVIAPVLGHALGLFDSFCGGKCIAVSFGVVFGLWPVTRIPALALVAFYLLFSFAIRIRSHTARSIVVYAIFGVTTGIFCGRYDTAVPVAVACLLISAIVVAKHLLPLFLKSGDPEKGDCGRADFQSEKVGEEERDP